MKFVNNLVIFLVLTTYAASIFHRSNVSIRRSFPRSNHSISMRPPRTFNSSPIRTTSFHPTSTLRQTHNTFRQPLNTLSRPQRITPSLLPQPSRLSKRQDKNTNCANCTGGACAKACGGALTASKPVAKPTQNLPVKKSAPTVTTQNVPKYPVSSQLSRQQVTYYTPYWNRYHYHSYYPYYPFYWYFADHFYNHYPYYYSYYYHYHPSIVQSFRGPLIFDGLTIDPDQSGVTVFEDLKENSLRLRGCTNGPQYKFTARSEEGKEFRIFIGDVNDFFNIECIYMMNAIVSIGDIDYSDKLLKIYAHPSRSVSLVDYKDKVKVDPFGDNIYRPYEPTVKHITTTVRNLNFKIGVEELAFTDKNLIFYHSNDQNLKRVSNLVEELAEYVDSGNVLFVLDNFNRGTVKVYSRLHRYFTGIPVHRHIVYRNIRYLHHHHH